VSTTTKPVTHTADVAVNKAVTNPARSSLDATGNANNAVPTATAIANATAITRLGLRNALNDHAWKALTEQD
jgi:hypothetical protein